MDHTENRYALYHCLTLIGIARESAARSLALCDMCSAQAEQASPIVSPAQLAAANGRPVVDHRTHLLAASEQHAKQANQELRNLIAFAQQLAAVLTPPKAEPAPDPTVGGRLNGLHIAE